MATKSRPISTPVNVTFKLSNIRTEHFFIRDPQKKFNSKKEVIVNYNINCTIPNQLLNNCVIVILRISANIIETEERICEIVTGFRYEIHSINNKPIVEFEELDISEEIITTFVSISISTIRGILLEKTKGTILHKQMLPIIDPGKLVRDLKESITVHPQKQSGRKKKSI